MEEKIMELKNMIPDSNTKDMNKIAISGYVVTDNNNVDYGCHCNYIEDLNKYEIYMYVSTKNICASRINLSFSEEKNEANKIFENFVSIVNEKNIEKLKSLIK